MEGGSRKGKIGNKKAPPTHTHAHAHTQNDDPKKKGKGDVGRKKQKGGEEMEEKPHT
jgi:hypothetical protein